jgi:ABC-type polysaccharide/polyol phosphate transport system ATPase subunit
MILVSHIPLMVEKFCTRAVLLDQGHIISEGSGKDIAAQYSARFAVPVV